MSILNKIHIQLFYILVLLSFYACEGTKNPPPNKSENITISVSDFRGKDLHFEKPVQRAVCLIESALSGIYMIGAEKQVVGVSAQVYAQDVYPYYAAIDERILNKSLPAPGSWDFVSIEKVVSLNPDLVVIWASQTESIENLEKFGIPVYAVMLRQLDDVFKEMNDLGMIFGKEERSDSLINFTKENLAYIEAKTKVLEKKPVYFAWQQGITETSGTNSMVNELITISGGVNACTARDEHVVVNIENIAEWNPDVIVMWKNERQDPSDLMKIFALQNIDAIKNSRVYELPSTFECDFWTLKFQYASLLIASWMFPEQFAENEIHLKKENLFKTLYKTDFK